MLVSKKDEIRRLTEEILDLASNPMQNELELNKKVTAILSLLSTIASYAKCKSNDLERVTALVNLLQLGSEMELDFFYQYFCNTVNSITFNFTKRDFTIIIPKIDLAIFKA